ncbi:MAG: acyltransferase [Granulosicoccus sp.]
MMKLRQTPGVKQLECNEAAGTLGLMISERINAARVICIVMMMYVHVPSGQQTGGGVATASSTRLDHWLESILIEGPGRASAALLSVVSGYLIVFTLSRVDVSVLGLYVRRFKSIVMPMFFWALLTCCVYSVLDQGSGSFVDSAVTWHDKLNLVLFVYEMPFGATMHLAFLRDLFVCVLLSPLLLWALKRLPMVTLGSLGLVYLFEHSGNLYIVLRPLVIFGFTAGMLLALKQVRLDRLDEYWAWFLTMTGVFAVLVVWANAGLLNPVESYLAERNVSLKESILYPLCRLFGSLTIWCTLPLLKSTQRARLVSWFTPYLFVAFCSHFLVLSVLFNGIWVPLAGDRESYVYLIWFLSAPFVALAFSVVMVSAAARIYLPLASFISGGRIPLSNMYSESPRTRVLSNQVG